MLLRVRSIRMTAIWALILVSISIVIEGLEHPVNHPDCGIVYLKANKTHLRIIDGNEAIPGSWPWQVVLYGDRGWAGGGSVISSEFILIAAHCSEGYSDSYVNLTHVVAGDHDLSDIDGHEQQVRVARTFPHPKYNRFSTSPNDIALIQLREPLKFNNRVGPVCLPEPSEDLPVGTDVAVTGWGAIKYYSLRNITYQKPLQEAIVSVADLRVCQPKFWWVLKNSEGICTGPDSPKGICFGDSGGPLVVRRNGLWYQHGVTAFYGIPVCGTYRWFTKVSEYLDWITTTIRENRKW